jgi:SnoaL-like domain
MDERIEILGILGALAVHVDARRWDALAALFAPVVQVDYTSLFGGAAQATPREQLLATWRQLLPGFTHTTHVIGTPFVTISGDTAQAMASVVAWHFIKDRALAGNDLWLVGGCYEMSLAKLDGAWRITALTLARAWAEGNLDLPRIAGERAARR